jgi:hypothetical protein
MEPVMAEPETVTEPEAVPVLGSTAGVVPDALPVTVTVETEPDGSPTMIRSTRVPMAEPAPSCFWPIQPFVT